ncbi:MAG: 50S ribosomal protein L25/general stress protein Ctc [Leptolyngbyaceae bacterium]|nr:50S ribosomal protein L25/general stress protein Ctc [Leptolyngbyaceae bacterium]
MKLSIECKTRSENLKARALRREGLIPAVLYGHKGAESVALTIDEKEADTLVRKAAINNTLIDVKIPDQSWSGKAVLREVHTHPAKGFLYHLSFFSVAAQDSMEVTVPLHFVGEAVGVKEEQGTLETTVTEIQMRCAPEDIPEFIEVDVSEMKVGDVLHVSDMKLPEGAEPLLELKRTIAAVHAPRVAPQEEGEAAAVSEEPEVIETAE